jgi:hypothetical protein
MRRVRRPGPGRECMRLVVRLGASRRPPSRGARGSRPGNRLAGLAVHGGSRRWLLAARPDGGLIQQCASDCRLVLLAQSSGRMGQLSRRTSTATCRRWSTSEPSQTNETRWPASNERHPSPTTPLKWTKRTSPSDVEIIHQPASLPRGQTTAARSRKAETRCWPALHPDPRDVDVGHSVRAQFGHLTEVSLYLSDGGHR